jgi:hypothetical protein
VSSPDSMRAGVVAPLDGDETENARFEVVAGFPLGQLAASMLPGIASLPRWQASSFVCFACRQPRKHFDVCKRFLWSGMSGWSMVALDGLDS